MREFNNGRQGVHQLALTTLHYKDFPVNVAHPHREVIVVDISCDKQLVQTLIEKVIEVEKIYGF